MSFSINLRITERGFSRAEFFDKYGGACSIQKSSISGEDCVWLGREHAVCDDTGLFRGCRMHLTQEMAAALIPLLQRFVDTGELDDPAAS